MIIGITGTLGAGKGAVVSFLLKKGFRHYSVRDFLRGEILNRGLDVCRGNMVMVANDLRERFGSSYIVEELYSRAIKEGGNVIIESIRCPGEVDALRRRGDFVLFSLDADIEIRYSRIVERGGETDKISFEEFVMNEQQEMCSTDPNKQNIQKCIEMADYNFKNDWTIDELYSKVGLVLEKIISDDVFALKKGFSKREDVLSWDDYFMAIAMLSAQRSKDPSTQVGACIINSDKKIIGTGYNGFPTGCSDDDLPWNREGDFLDIKYSYVCHAELNAILNSSGKNLSGCSIYVALFPCNECAKAIIQSGIKEVVYLSDKYADVPAYVAAKKMFDMAGVKIRQMIPNKNSLTIFFDNK